MPEVNVIPPWRVPEPPPSVVEGYQAVVDAEVVKNLDQEVVQAPVAVEEPKVEQVVVPTKKYRAVRGSGDPIYILKDGKKHWVLNGETYKKLGYEFGEEEKIEQSELATYPPGKPITQENYTEFI
jgi:hypothetical protein